MPARSNNTYDFCIIGSGVVGLSLANQLVQQGHENIILIEKEADAGKHASGRNSGVLHAGIYYPQESLKAKFCLAGNHYWQSFCRQHALPCLNTGKIVVCKNQDDLAVLESIEARSKANGATVELVNAKKLLDIEPLAKTYQTALVVSDTCVVSPTTIIDKLKQLLLATGKITFAFNTRVIDASEPHCLVTNRGDIYYNTLVNAAGAYADVIAHQCNIGIRYRLLPFKGYYKKLSNQLAKKIQANIYPVPDLKYPFLGIHFTKSIHHDVYIGPNAAPALGPENYHRFKNIKGHFSQIIKTNLGMMIHNKDFRHIAYKEPFNALTKHFYREAKQLLHGLKPEHIQPCSKMGIRPQLVDWQQKSLVMDFVIEKNDYSIHILNAISPAFTSAPAFAKHCVQSIL